MNKLKEKLKHFFIPHEGNDFKAHIFRDSTLGILFVIVVLTFVAGVGQKFALTTTNFLASIYSGVLVDLANNDRNENSLPSLKINPLLESAAQLKAEDMAAKGYFAHYGPDGSSPWDWMRKAGYQFTYAGENLAIDFTDSEDVNEAWLNSPTHRANIMNAKYTEIGIATVKGKYNGRNTIYVVQMFGTPANIAQTLPIVTPVPVNQLTQNTEGNVTPEVQGATLAQTPKVQTPPKVIAATPKKTNTINLNTTTTTTSTASFIETESSSTVAAPITDDSNNKPVRIGLLKEISTNPSKTVGVIYGFASLMLVIGLIATIRRDMQIHHLRHAMGGVFLMIIIVTLTYIYNHAVFSSAVIAFNS